MSHLSMWSVFKLLFLPSLSFIIIAVFVVSIIAWLIGKVREIDFYILIFTFGLLGGILGVTSGASRTPVVGDVLPALLTIITALLTYLFGKESFSRFRLVIPYCIIALLLTSYFGMISGSSIIRGNYEQFERDYKKRFLRYEKLELEIEKAKELNKLKIEFEKEKLRLQSDLKAKNSHK